MKKRRSFARACISNIVGLTVPLVLQVLVVIPGGAQTRIPLQPFAQQVRQVQTTLAYLGQPLSQTDRVAIDQLLGDADEYSAASRLEHILDRYTLAIVEINPESRVKVQQSLAKSRTHRGGNAHFLG